MVCLKAELVKHVEEEGYDLTVKYLFNSNKYSALISHTLPFSKLIETKILSYSITI